MTIAWDGLECERLANGALSLLVTRSAGMRIIALSLADGPNLLARLPEGGIDCPGAGRFTFYGGHRLWHAPELPERTYQPDDDPPEIALGPRSLTATQPVERATGLQKTLRIALPDPAAALVVIEHRLANRGLWPVECAPWAITQLPTGGVALLPQTGEPADRAGVLPNRFLAIWPYTDLAAPQLGWGQRIIRVSVDGGPLGRVGPFKLGWPNPVGWLAYARAGTVFVKHALYDPAARYCDSDSSSQCYADHRFAELETLGPLAPIEPGATAIHREVWTIHRGDLADFSEAAALALMDSLDLGQAATYLRMRDDQLFPGA